MKIRSLGFTSFKLGFKNVDIITDPLRTEEAGLKISKVKGDLILFSGEEYYGKKNILEEASFSAVEPGNREELLEINNPGDYESGGVLIRRTQGMEYYVIARKDIRVVYIGVVDKKVDPEHFKSIEGDVDVLIAPVGNGDELLSYDKLEKIIKTVDPTYLVPSMYQVDGLDKEYDSLKTVDEFIKHFGYTHVSREKSLKVKKGTSPDTKVVEVVVLE
jgi:hypothetical protein